MEEKKRANEEAHKTYAKSILNQMGPGKPKAIGYMEGGNWQLIGDTWAYVIRGKITFTPQERSEAKELSLETDEDGYIWNPWLLTEWITLNRDLIPSEIKTPADYVFYVKKNKIATHPLVNIIHGTFADHERWIPEKSDGIILPTVVKNYFSRFQLA